MVNLIVGIFLFVCNSIELFDHRRKTADSRWY